MARDCTAVRERRGRSVRRRLRDGDATRTRRARIAANADQEEPGAAGRGAAAHRAAAAAVVAVAAARAAVAAVPVPPPEPPLPPVPAGSGGVARSGSHRHVRRRRHVGRCAVPVAGRDRAERLAVRRAPPRRPVPAGAAVHKMLPQVPLLPLVTSFHARLVAVDEVALDLPVAVEREDRRRSAARPRWCRRSGPACRRSRSRPPGWVADGGDVAGGAEPQLVLMPICHDGIASASLHELPPAPAPLFLSHAVSVQPRVEPDDCSRLCHRRR